MTITTKALYMFSETVNSYESCLLVECVCDFDQPSNLMLCLTERQASTVPQDHSFCFLITTTTCLHAPAKLATRRSRLCTFAVFVEIHSLTVSSFPIKTPSGEIAFIDTLPPMTSGRSPFFVSFRFCSLRHVESRFVSVILYRTTTSP